MQKPLLLVALALLAAGCGSESSIVESLATVGGAAVPAARPRPTPKPAPPPPISASSLALAGDVTVDDHDPDVIVEPVLGPGGRVSRLRVELRHREGGSSQPDAVVVFLNVPAQPGTYPLRSPENPPVAGRVYAVVTTRGNAVGSLKDFNTAVAGTLTLSRDGEALAGSFRLTAQEPPPPPSPRPGQPLAQQVGTVPPAPLALVQVEGRLLAMLPAPLVLPAPPVPPVEAAAAGSPGG